MELGKLLLFIVATCLTYLSSLVVVVEAAKVICYSSPDRWCFQQSVPCPLRCARKCSIDCSECSSSCNLSRCAGNGTVCQDPRFVGGDGKMFYFHGKKNQDFCIVSDPELHINAHFIGKTKTAPGLKRDFTWVQSLGILFGKHKLYIGAKKVGVWDDNVDQVELQLDETPIRLPSGEGAKWDEPQSRLRIVRLGLTNDISIQVSGLFELKAKVVPVTKQESKIHKYDITDEDCFAHLDLSFRFDRLSSKVSGVLGQTYAPDYQSRVDSTSAMPIMGGYSEYLVSELMTADCSVSKFNLVEDGDAGSAKFSFPAMKCGTDSKGFACRRR